LFKTIITVLVLSFLSMPVVAGLETEPALIWEVQFNSSISAMAFSPDGNHIAVGCYDGSIRVFNRTFDLVWSGESDEAIRAVSISSRGRVLTASGSTLRLYEPEGSVWKGDLGFIKDASISGNSRGVAAANSTTVTYIDTAIKPIPKGTYTFSTESPLESIASFATSSYRTWLVAAGDQEAVYLFSRRGLLWSYPVHERVTDVAISPDGGYVAAGTDGGYVYLFDKEGYLLWSRGVGSRVYSLSVSREAGYVAVGSGEGILLINTDNDVVWTAYTGPVVAVGISSGGDRIAAASGRTVALFKVPDTTPLAIEIVSPEDGSTVSGRLKIDVKRTRASPLSIRLDGTEISTRPSYTLDTRFITNGWHTITVEASDLSGGLLRAEVEVLVENRENIPPPLKILSIEDGDILSGRVRIYVLSNLLIEDFAILIDGIEVSKKTPYLWDTRSYEEGAHEITVVGKRLGEVYSDSVLVFVDNIPDRVSPFVKILQPFPKEKVQGLEAVRGVFTRPPSEVYVKIDDRIVSNALPYIWDTDSEEEGPHEITLFVLDEAGNLGYYTTTVVKPEADDPDGDGWSNELEKLFRTDPQNPDTDGDGIIDSKDEDPLRDQSVFYRYLYGVLFLLLVSAALIRDKDLRLILAVTLAAAVFIAVQPFNTLPLRVPLGLFLVFFASGYAFISALFPKREISPIERFTLSVAFSIAIFVFNGFALNYTWGFRTVPIVVSISAITLIFSLMAALIRRAYPETERFSLDFALPKFTSEPPSEIERTLITALVLSILVAGGMLVYAKLTFNHEEFTALSILGEGGKAEDYPKGFYLGDPQEITVLVENYERSPANYNLEVRLNGALLREEKFSLDNEEKWLKDISFIPTQAGDRSKLEFLLYKDGGPNPYRSVHLWVSSRPNYANNGSFENYLLRELPVIENQDFELNYSGWHFTSTNINFTGGYTADTYTSFPSSYMLSLPRGKKAPEGAYATVSQDIISEGEGLALLSFNLRDSYGSPGRGRYLLQVLLNGRVVWEKDAAGARGWEHFVVPVNLVPGPNTLELRLYQKGSSAPITVWWDDIELGPLGILFAL